MTIQSARPLNDRFLTVEIPDVSTAGQRYVASPVRGRLIKAYSALNGAITVGDAILTIKVGSVTAGTITIANSGSAAGDVDEVDLDTYVNEAGTIEVETDGGSTDAAAAVVTLVIRE